MYVSISEDKRDQRQTTPFFVSIFFLLGFLYLVLDSSSFAMANRERGELTENKGQVTRVRAMACRQWDKLVLRRPGC